MTILWTLVFIVLGYTIIVLTIATRRVIKKHVRRKPLPSGVKKEKVRTHENVVYVLKPANRKEEENE